MTDRACTALRAMTQGSDLGYDSWGSAFNLGGDVANVQPFAWASGEIEIAEGNAQ